jgi:methyl-accepting chemotaxis protein
VIVNPSRQQDGFPLSRRVGLDRIDDPVAQAVLGHTAGPPVHAIDHRGRDVWAATRHLPDPGWGLVVKIDAEEQEQPVLDLRRYMVRLALALSAFAILTGTVLGLSLARPIRQLADVANRIRAGDLDARAESRGDDEIGDLARTFNLMAAKLIETNRALARQLEANGDADETESTSGDTAAEDTGATDSDPESASS